MKLKRLGYGLSAVALTASMTPMAVFAEGELSCTDVAVDKMAEATETTVCADTAAKLQAAVGYSKFSKIVLTGDIEISSVLGIAHDVTLNLGGQTLSSTKGTPVFSVTDGATLTVDDTANGKIVSGEYIARVNASKFVLNNGTLTATEPRAYGVFPSWGGSATINGGSITADYAAFSGNNTTGDMNFYINGGTLTSEKYPAIYMPGQVYLTMTGGTLNGGIVARLGQITISGGTINNSRTEAYDGDDLSENYSSMPSMTESVALIAGTYNSDNGDFGNKLTFTMTGGKISDGLKLYDLGRDGEKYAQNVELKISGGEVSEFGTGFTDETIGFKVASGYTAGANNAADRISAEVSGGKFSVAPAAEYVKAGLVAARDAWGDDLYNIVNPADESDEIDVEELPDGDKIILPVELDLREAQGLSNDGLGDEDTISGTVVLRKELVADRKAALSIEKIDAKDLAVNEEKAGEVVLAFDIDLLDRNGAKIEVKDNDIAVYLTLTKEQYEALKEYDDVKVVYFEDGKEAERLDAELYADEMMGDVLYSLVFYTTHFSSYGVVGVNEAEAPDTGAFTAEAGSNVAGAIVTAVVVAVVTMAGVALKLNKR